MGKSYGMILYLVPSIKGIPLGLKKKFLLSNAWSNKSKPTRKFISLVLYV